MTATQNKLLKLISGNDEIIIEKTSGEKDLESAKDVFTEVMSIQTNSYKNDQYVPTERTSVSVYEITDFDTASSLFDSLDMNQEKLCLTQHQIREFCISHKNWLAPFGLSTIFLFQVQRRFSIAKVVQGVGLQLHIMKFESGHYFRKEFGDRVIAPKLS